MTELQKTGEKMLQGRTAILSGGLGDIGRAIGRMLAQHGANVALGDVADPSAAESELRTLRAWGGEARYDVADVSDAQAVRRWVEAVEGQFGAPDLVICAAAIVTFVGIEELTAEQWRREMAVNLDGTFHLAHAAAQRLIACGRPGRIVMIGSWAGHRPQEHIPTYCVAKAGLRMLCQCLALSLASHQILVNEVAPGYVDAGLTHQAFRRDPSRRNRAIEHTPVRQLMNAEDVARQVLHLCDPTNVHMTGTTLLIDGGLSLLSRPR